MVENHRVKRAVYLNDRINEMMHKYGDADFETVCEYLELIDSFTAEEDTLFMQELDKTNCS